MDKITKCSKWISQGCQGCTVKNCQVVENFKIAENLRDYWKHLNSHAEVG